MWRVILILGGVLWIGGAVQLAADLLAYRQSGTFEFAPLGQVWFDHAPGLLNGLQVVLERYLWPPLWDPAMLTVLLWPASLIGLFIGTLLLALGVYKTKKPASS